MDFQLLGLTFVTVFLSELGDKSQVAAIALSGTTKSPRAIFFGTAGALLLASFLGVIVGQGVAEVLPTHLVKIAAAIGFAVLGMRLLWFSQEDSSETE
ncbi:MAG TPA: TMEM165/GDT1 family protein [Candidatus Obscuribacterales bacterium]